jgi:transposase InsO family protein
VYLATLMDLHSRKIAGWSPSKSPNQDITLEALEAAVEYRRALQNEKGREARLAIFEYIEGVYNTTRRHSSLDYQ